MAGRMKSGLDLQGSLGLLEESRLIRTLAEAEAAFAFKHSLIQQVAYESMLVQDRRDLHLRVGAILETEIGRRGPEIADVLSTHFERAGRSDLALRYARMAGEDSMRRFATAEAAEQFGRAITLAGHAGADNTEVISLYLARGRALELGARYEEALSVYQQLERLGAEHGDLHMELAAVSGAASMHAVPTRLYDSDRALALSDRALELAQRIGDPEGETKALWLRMLAETRRDPHAAIRTGEAALAMARQHGFANREAFILNDISGTYFVTGEPEKARRAAEEAEPIWRRLDNLPMLADNLASSALLSAFLGRYDDAIRRSRESLAISERTGNLWGQSYGRVPIAISYFGRGDLGPSIQEMARCIELAELAGFLYPQATGRSILALTLGRAGAFDQAEREARRVLEVEQGRTMPGEAAGPALLAWLAVHRGNLDEASRRMEESGLSHTEVRLSFMENPLPVVLAQIDYSLAAGEAARTQEIAERLLAEAEAIGSHLITPYLNLALGRSLIRLGRPDEGRQALETALARHMSLGVRDGSWEVEHEMARLAEGEGRMEDAGRLFHSAARHVRGIADGLAELGLDRAFLSRPPVREILERARESPSGV